MYFLVQARRRQRYFQMVRSVIERNLKDQCDECGKTRDDGVRLFAEMGSDGKYDGHAIDKLIYLYEVEYPEQGENIVELLWIGFFRKHGEFLTRCDECRSKFEASQAGGREARRIKKTLKPRDLSSDEDDTLKVTFDPIIVSRSSSVGVLLQKWLSASRKRLGGVFPRPNAAAELEKYTRRIKKKADNKRAKPKDEDLVGTLVVPEKLPLTAASVAIAKRWLTLSRDRIISALRRSSQDALAALRDTMRNVTPDEDWYFTSETRLKGEALFKDGQQLLESRIRMEEEERCV